MLAFGIVLNLAGLGFFCWLLFELAVHALPFFVSVSVGFVAVHGGAGPIGAILVALISGVVTLVAGQMAFGVTRSPLIRAAIATLFAAPAALAGYHVTLALSHLDGSAAIWREAFGLIGAMLVGGTTWTRIALHSSPDSGQGFAAEPDRLCGRPATRNW